jgi:hypothetical protein
MALFPCNAGYQPFSQGAACHERKTGLPVAENHKNAFAPEFHFGSHSAGHPKLTSQRTIRLVKITNEKQMLWTYEEEQNGHRDKGRRIGYYEEGTGLSTFFFDFDYWILKQ